MLIKKEYFTAEQFLFGCIYYKSLPLIRWNDDKGFIYFRVVEEKEEFHIFHSKNKKLLDAIWNSCGMIRHAVKLVEEVK